ncbi:MAG: hypothetical protein KC615_19435, partial [Anaerolineae bacterium]|nr:hypothetical protein [Anaerolineae bacterium]
MAQIAKQKHVSEIQETLNSWEARWRVQRLLVNLPLALVGLLAVAVIAVLLIRVGGLLPIRSLLPLVGLFLGISIGAVFAWYMLRRRPLLHSAQQFDRQFGLQERLSTALELTDGRIKTLPQIARRQLEDAALVAERVDVRQQIRLEMRWLHWLGVLIMAILLMILLLIPDAGGGTFSNPAADAAIAEAVEDVRDMTEAVANETDLTPEEREQLLQSLEQALDDLEEPNTTPEEAFAAVSNLEEELRQQANDLRQTNEVKQGEYNTAAETLNNALNELGGSESSAPDDIQSVEETLSAMQQALENLTPEQQQALSEAMQQAAEQLANSPELQEALEQAAQAMQAGDNQLTQEQLEQALEQLLQQQEQQQQREEAAQNLEMQAETANEAAEQIAQAEQGQQPPSEQPQSEQTDQTGFAPSSEQSEDAQPGQGQEGEQASSESESESAQPGDQPGNQQGQQGEGAQMQEGNQQSMQGQQGGGAGDGEGGQDSGPTAPGEVDGSNSPDGEGEFDYEEVYAPRRLDAEGSTDIQLESDQGDQPVVEGEFQENPEGESTVPYN